MDYLKQFPFWRDCEQKRNEDGTGSELCSCSDGLGSFIRFVHEGKHDRLFFFFLLGFSFHEFPRNVFFVLFLHTIVIVKFSATTRYLTSYTSPTYIGCYDWKFEG